MIAGSDALTRGSAAEGATIGLQALLCTAEAQESLAPEAMNVFLPESIKLVNKCLSPSKSASDQFYITHVLVQEPFQRNF